MRTVTTLIRLGECPGWSESSLGAQPFYWICHVAAHIHSDPNIQDTCIHEYTHEYWVQEIHKRINLKEYIRAYMLFKKKKKKNVFALSWKKYFGSRTVRKKSLFFYRKKILRKKPSPPLPPFPPPRKIKWLVPKQVFSWRGSYGVMLSF